jgi:Ca2+-binding EF-hand superfamily protein
LCSVVVVDIVDPNRDGYVSLQEYMAFMISKETENVQSSEEIENAFRAITAGDRPYVTKEELYAVSKLDIHMSVHRNIIPDYSQQDATLQYLYKKAELSDNILIVTC